MRTLKTAIVGCGKISGIYLENLTGKFSHAVEVVAVADAVPARAEKAAEDYSIPKACSTEEILDNPEVDLILNLTIPQAHYEVSLCAVQAGKHVYVEKPLTVSREEAETLLLEAERRGVRVGCAPDTFLGAGIQTCGKLISEGKIGTPVAATAFMMNRGHEGWHPDPEFYYKKGGGPMFDMGPYYLTALVSLLGPVSRLSGTARITFPERLITSEPKRGSRIQVEVPTHVSGLLEFASGASGTIITSFDVMGHGLPCIEIYGSTGSLRVPDPNTFGGPVFLLEDGSSEWKEIPLAFEHAENSRGLGVADMAQAILENRAHRASGELAFHVLDLMHGFHDSASSGMHYSPRSR